MVYFARVIAVITRTGGEVFDVVKVNAEHGVAAVSQIVDKFHVSPMRVYLISEDEAQSWAELGISIKEIL
jgi:hypothetical protein